MTSKINPLRKYIRNGKLPHFFCPGCGCGQVLNYFLKVIDDLKLNLNEIITIGGVGCTARIPVYLSTDSFHGVHGRTLAWATGIKLYRPDLKVVIFAGDGDLVSIGGNHFIHAARRNLDVTVFMVNNFNFAMTGGQVAPTTLFDSITMTTPFGSKENPFDVCNLAKCAGATYVSRWTTTKPLQTIKSMKKALQHKGFSLVEILSQCPTNFGRYALKTGNTEKVLKWMDDHSILKDKTKGLSEDDLKNKFILGDFVEINKPIFQGTTIYDVNKEEVN
ncbi:MAG: thiamine pyrophosphate-dependent enzyme [Atribacterota bacterium]